MDRSREQAVADLVAKVTEEAENVTVHFLKMTVCYQKHPDGREAQAACAHETFGATQALLARFPELAAELVGPAYRVIACDGRDGIGGTQFGGVPSVGHDFEWPLSTGFTIGEAAEDFAHLFRRSPVSLDAPLPLTFVAQIDLIEMSPEISELPATGRLLFFMDYGSYWLDDARASVRVIWDRTPADALTRQDPPEALVWLEGLAQKNWDDMTPMVSSLAERMGRAFGLGAGAGSGAALEEEEVEAFNAGYMPPERSAELRLEWQSLSPRTLEVSQSHYADLVRATDAFDIYLDVGGEWPVDRDDINPPYHQVAGQPWPEQDDPRYEAYFHSLLGRPVVSAEDFEAVRTMIGLEGAARDAHEAQKAAEFRLLLQLDVESFVDMDAEGSFYFFLHEADLAARNFDAVIVVYQQT